MANEIAKRILEQLGGNRFIAMTSAKNFVASENALAFKIGRNSKGVTHVRITLMPEDVYKVEFLKIRSLEAKTISNIEGVHCDMLQDIFTAATGLYTSL